MFSRFWRIRVGFLMLLFAFGAFGGTQATGFATKVSGAYTLLFGIGGALLVLSAFFETGRADVPPMQRWEPVADNAMLLGLNGRWAEAMPEFQRAMAMTGPEPRRLRAAELIGGYLLQHKKPTEAIPYLLDALRLRERLVGASMPETLALRERISDLYLEAGEPASAAHLLSIQTELLASPIEPIGHAHAAAKLGIALHQLGDVGGAENAARRAMTAIDVAGPYDPALPKSLISAADLEVARGNYERSESLLTRARECAERIGAKDDLRAIRAHLLSVYLAAGRYAEAVPLSEKVISDTTVAGKVPDPIETARVHRRHAELLDLATQPEGAAKHRRIAETLERIANPHD